MSDQIDIGDVVLNVVQAGEGTPLLLVHGFPLDHSMWQRQIAELASDFRVIAPDLRGFGKSRATPDSASTEPMTTDPVTTAKTTDAVTMSQYADDMAQLLQRLKISEPVVFCGLSMGGYIAWQFWKNHSEMLRALILCDTRAAADTTEVARGRELMASNVLRQGMEQTKPMLKKLFAASTHEKQPAVIEATWQVMSNTDPRAVAAAQLGMAVRPDVTDQLAAIKVPTLLICGESDGISPPQEMREISVAIPNSIYHEVATAGHLAPLEQPDDANGAIRKFLNALPTTKS